MRDSLNGHLPMTYNDKKEAWINDKTYYNLDARLEVIDAKMRYEELRYARFMARRHYIASVIPPSEFRQLVS